MLLADHGRNNGDTMKAQIAIALAFLALTPAAAPAQTQEEQQACTDDAFNVCGEAIPDRDRVAACLAQNINRISAACRTVMLRYQRQETTPTASTVPMNVKTKPTRAFRASCKPGTTCARKRTRQQARQ